MFSKATEYALRAVIFIAQKSTVEKKIGIPEIAKAIDSPQAFTAKILQSLSVDSKVISSVRGPHGGFYMNEVQKKLPVRAVLAAMGEVEVFEKCVLGLQQCSELKPCPMHSGYKQIKHELISLFETKTIQTLVDEMMNTPLYISNKAKRKTEIMKR